MALSDEQLVWRKNASFMFDVAFSRGLEWPSLTVDWLPRVVEEEECSVHSLVIGTHTAEGAMNEMHVVSVRLPVGEIDAREDFGKDLSEIVKSFSHPCGESNRLRHAPLEPKIVASKCANGEVYVFDIEKEGGPVSTLRGHSDEGFGLSWDPFLENRLASCAYDGSICLFDVDKEVVLCTRKDAHGKGNPVGDVAYSNFRKDFLGSVGDDARVSFWSGLQEKPLLSFKAHEADINSLSFSQHEDFYFVTGSADRTVKLWDLRQPSKALHSLDRPSDVVSVAWAPFGRAFVAAISGTKVSVLDLTEIGADTKELQKATGIEDDNDTNVIPELVIDHSGHTGKLNAVAWSNNQNDLLGASVADDNSLQIWLLNSDLYENDDTNDNEPYDFFDTLQHTTKDDVPPAKRAKQQQTKV